MLVEITTFDVSVRACMYLAVLLNGTKCMDLALTLFSYCSAVLPTDIFTFKCA